MESQNSDFRTVKKTTLIFFFFWMDLRSFFRASQVVLVVKNPLAIAGGTRDATLIPGSGRCPGGGNGKPRQYSCLENPMDRGDWQATVHNVTKSQI